MRGLKLLGNWTVQVIVGVCLNRMVYCHLVASMSNVFTFRLDENVTILLLLAFWRADARLTLLYCAILGKSYSLLQCRCSCQFCVHSSLYCAVLEC